MNRLVPLLGWLALALGVWALVRAGGSAERDQVGHETLLTYPLDPDVRFALSAGEAEVKLVTWLVTQDAWTEDPRVMLPFALDLRVEGPTGEEVEARRVWVSTRRAVEIDEEGVRLPTAALPKAPGRVSEDRLVRIELEGKVPQGGTLRVRAAAAPPGAQVLVVAFRRLPRAEVARLRLLHGDAGEFREEAVEELAAFDWDSLPASWRATLARDRWERLGGLPEAGGLLPTVRLSTGFAHTQWAQVPAEGFLLPPGGAAAFNLTGAATFEADWRDAWGRPVAPVASTVRVVHADGTIETHAAAPADHVGPLQVDDDVVSVQIALDPASEPRLLRARVHGDATWGDPPRLRPDDAGVQAVGPDVRSLELYRAGPGWPALRYPVRRGELLRLQLRPRLDPAPLHGFDPPPAEAARSAHLQFLDEGGKVLAEFDTSVAAVPSAFERYTQVDTPATARVSDADVRLVVPPVDAAELRVDAYAPVDVSLRVAESRDLVAQWEPRYELPPDEAVNALYVPMARDRWRARAPHDVETLAETGRVVRMDAQVRLEPEAPDPDPADVPTDDVASRPWFPLPIGGPFELLAEAARTDAAPTDDAPGARVRLGSDERSVIVPADGRLEIDYRVATAGRPVRVWTGGSVRTLTPPTAGGVFQLGPLSPGSTRVLVEGAGLFLARSTGNPAWRVRRAWAVQPGKVLGIDFPGGAGGVILHTWLAAGQSAWLSWTVEDVPPSPPGLYTRITERHGLVELRPTATTAEPLSFAGAPLVAAAPVRIPLGEDVGGQRGRITVSLEGARAPAWLRASATWPPAVADATSHWTRGAPE